MKKYSLEYDGDVEKELTPQELELKYDVLKMKLQHQCAWSDLPKDMQAQALHDIELEIEYEKLKDLTWDNEELQSETEFHEMFNDLK